MQVLNAKPISQEAADIWRGAWGGQAITAGIFLWIGVAFAGNLVAAPAKFQAASLTLPVALDVGRVQFLWIGFAEAICLLVILCLLGSARRWPSWPLIAATAVFALQRIWLLPLLDIRTLAIIGGAQVEDSLLHFVYVAAEILKAACLAWAGAQSLRRGLPQTG